MRFILVVHITSCVVFPLAYPVIKVVIPVKTGELVCFTANDESRFSRFKGIRQHKEGGMFVHTLRSAAGRRLLQEGSQQLAPEFHHVALDSMISRQQTSSSAAATLAVTGPTSSTGGPWQQFMSLAVLRYPKCG